MRTLTPASKVLFIAVVCCSLYSLSIDNFCAKSYSFQYHYDASKQSLNDNIELALDHAKNAVKLAFEDGDN